MSLKVRSFTGKDNVKRWNSSALHPLQSWEWGEARSKMGIEVLRVGAFQGSGLKDVFQVTFHKIPYTSNTIGYLPKSVIPPREVCTFLEREGMKRNCVFYKIEPTVTKSALMQKNARARSLLDEYEKFREKVKESAHPLFPKWTIHVDLTKGEDILLGQLKQKTRYNINIAKKKGITVKEMSNSKGFEIFQKMYFDTCARQKYRGHSEKYHRIVFETMRKEISHILIAFYGKTPLSAYHLFTFNDVLYYPYGGSSPEYRNLMASNLLMWETIRYGTKMWVYTF